MHEKYLTKKLFDISLIGLSLANFLDMEATQYFIKNSLYGEANPTVAIVLIYSGLMGFFVLKVGMSLVVLIGLDEPRPTKFVTGLAFFGFLVYSVLIGYHVFLFGAAL